MVSIVDAAFNRARFTFLALIIAIIAGASAFSSMPREADPDIPLPFVMVYLPLPGVSPEDAENLLIKPAETEFQSLEGLKQMDAVAYEGAAQFVLEFEIETNIDLAIADVTTAIDRAKTKFPQDAREPIIEELNTQTMFPILSIIISGDVPERTMLRLAKQLQDRLQSLPGMLEAELVGDREEVLEINIKPEVLKNYGLSELEIAAAVQNNNALITAGSMRFDDGAYSVKLPGLLRTLDDIKNIPIRSDGQGVILLGDIAEIHRTFEDANAHALFQGERAIGINLAKRSGANIIELTQKAKAEALEMAATWPQGVNVHFIGDQSTFVQTILSGLTSSIFLAIILVMIVLVAAMGMRSAIMVGIAIPSSFLIGIMFMNLAGFTLNMMVMFAMVLAVGMLVDGAIVVVEYADRKMSEGYDRRDAYLDAAKRMFWPIVASTATTLAAFIPLLFWNSIPGKFMANLPQTLIFVLCSSLAVALIFLPLLGAYAGLPDWWKNLAGIKGKTDQKPQVEMDNVDPTKSEGPIGYYARAMSWAIERPFLVILATVSILWVCQNEFKLSDPAMEFFLDPDSEQILIIVEGRGNLSEAEKKEIALEVQSKISDHEEIEFIYARTGAELARERDAPAETMAHLTVDLIDFSKRKHSLKIIDELRLRLADMPGVHIEVRPPPQGPDTGKDVQVELYGADYDTLVKAAKLLRTKMENMTSTVNGQTVSTLMDIEDTLPLPGIEMVTHVDREEASRFGISQGQIGAMLQLATEGLLVDTYRPDDSDEEIDIKIRFPADARKIDAIDNLTIQTPNGSVPISNFITVEPTQQIDKITRRDSRRILDIKANANVTVPGAVISQDGAISAVRTLLQSGAVQKEVNANFQWKLRGANEETEEAGAFFAIAMLAAMAMIGAILLLQFNNIYHAFLTLSAVVMAVFGVLFALSFIQGSISFLMVGIGIFALAGIVVNNNIVLIDTYQYMREIGLPVREAAIRTAAQRMRPVLLTTITTILGLMPMVLAINVNFQSGQISHGSEVSDWWTLLSLTIVTGLAFATLLTLIFTPVMLAAPVTIRHSVMNALLFIIKASPVLNNHFGHYFTAQTGQKIIVDESEDSQIAKNTGDDTQSYGTAAE
ncbi:MAG: efflux RND transporter permease subunit [bacterium]